MLLNAIEGVDDAWNVFTKAEFLDDVRHVESLGVGKHLKVVDVGVVILVTLSGGDVNVSGHLLHLQVAVHEASLAALRIEFVQEAFVHTLGGVKQESVRTKIKRKDRDEMRCDVM